MNEENSITIHLSEEYKKMLDDIHQWASKNWGHAGKHTQIHSVLMAIRHTHGMLDRMKTRNAEHEKANNSKD